MIKYIHAVWLLPFVACQGPANGPAASPLPGETLIRVAKFTVQKDTTTLGGTWVLEPMLASDSATGKLPRLNLDLGKSRFSGTTGCNSMHGQFWYSKKDSSLSFSDKLITTKMACPGYNEAAFLKSLRSTGRYRLRDGVLSLLSDDNTELSRWARKPGTAPKAFKT
jgi:heat shock protein HslJ